MAHRFVLFATILFGFLGVSGCGGATTPAGTGGGDTGGGGGNGGGGDGGEGDGGGGTPPDPLLSIITDEAVRLAYQSTFLPDVTAVDTAARTGDPMAFASLPATGTLDYEGYMSLQVFSAIASADIDGIAVLSFALGDNTISGTVDGFRGMVTNNEQDYLVSYDGILTLSNGFAAIGDLPENALRDINDEASLLMIVDGTLDNGLNLFVIDGVLEGTLNGFGGEGLRAKGSGFSSSLGSMNITIDGVSGQLGVGTLSAQLVPPPP